MVVWRQSRALELLRELDQYAHGTRAIAEAERSEVNRQIEYLEIRARVVSEAGKRLDMRVPTGDEIVFMLQGDRPASARSPSRRGRAFDDGTLP